MHINKRSTEQPQGGGIHTKSNNTINTGKRTGSSTKTHRILNSQVFRFQAILTTTQHNDIHQQNIQSNRMNLKFVVIFLNSMR